MENDPNNLVDQRALENEINQDSQYIDQLDKQTRKVQKVKHDWGMDFDDYQNGGYKDD